MNLHLETFLAHWGNPREFESALVSIRSRPSCLQITIFPHRDKAFPSPAKHAHTERQIGCQPSPKKMRGDLSWGCTWVTNDMQATWRKCGDNTLKYNLVLPSNGLLFEHYLWSYFQATKLTVSIAPQFSCSVSFEWMKLCYPVVYCFSPANRISNENYYAAQQLFMLTPNGTTKFFNHTLWVKCLALRVGERKNKIDRSPEGGEINDIGNLRACGSYSPPFLKAIQVPVLPSLLGPRTLKPANSWNQQSVIGLPLTDCWSLGCVEGVILGGLRLDDWEEKTTGQFGWMYLNFIKHIQGFQLLLRSILMLNKRCNVTDRIDMLTVSVTYESFTLFSSVTSSAANSTKKGTNKGFSQSLSDLLVYHLLDWFLNKALLLICFFPSLLFITFLFMKQFMGGLILSFSNLHFIYCNKNQGRLMNEIKSKMKLKNSLHYDLTARSNRLTLTRLNFRLEKEEKKTNKDLSPHKYFKRPLRINTSGFGLRNFKQVLYFMYLYYNYSESLCRFWGILHNTGSSWPCQGDGGSSSPSGRVACTTRGLLWEVLDEWKWYGRGCLDPSMSCHECRGIEVPLKNYWDLWGQGMFGSQ
ncbi:hypothetical protein VP01_959g1 [Puccinia sorghi]|uniref:Uncharacterized protein n=1 Tax=Puccinia sorghi TaxID=27349 RepID=A0A0L6U8B1_9BASI|nr:hypothetical protein VP01_959g1 [Puccinia sorghi]